MSQISVTWSIEKKKKDGWKTRGGWECPLYLLPFYSFTCFVCGRACEPWCLHSAATCACISSLVEPFVSQPLVNHRYVCGVSAVRAADWLRGALGGACVARCFLVSFGWCCWFEWSLREFLREFIKSSGSQLLPVCRQRRYNLLAGLFTFAYEHLIQLYSSKAGLCAGSYIYGGTTVELVMQVRGHWPHQKCFNVPKSWNSVYQLICVLTLTCRPKLRGATETWRSMRPRYFLDLILPATIRWSRTAIDKDCCRCIQTET